MPLSRPSFTHCWTAAAAQQIKFIKIHFIKTTTVPFFKCLSDYLPPYTESRLMVSVSKNVLYIHLWLKALPSLTWVFTDLPTIKFSFFQHPKEHKQTKQAAWVLSSSFRGEELQATSFPHSLHHVRNVSAVKFCRGIAIEQGKSTRTSREPCLQTCHCGELLWQLFLYERECFWHNHSKNSPELNFSCISSSLELRQLASIIRKGNLLFTQELTKFLLLKGEKNAPWKSSLNLFPGSLYSTVWILK